MRRPGTTLSAKTRTHRIVVVLRIARRMAGGGILLFIIILMRMLVIMLLLVLIVRTICYIPEKGHSVGSYTTYLYLWFCLYLCCIPEERWAFHRQHACGTGDQRRATPAQQLSYYCCCGYHYLVTKGEPLWQNSVECRTV